MDWISNLVAIGDYKEAGDPAFLSKHSIRSILGLINTLNTKSAVALGVERIEIVTLLDGPGNDLSRFTLAVETLAELASKTSPVLIHCRAGWSRSPAVVAGYLVHSFGMTTVQALAEVHSKRECSMVPEMRELVEKYARARESVFLP
jgi:protein-tyrosine phosphatase